MGQKYKNVKENFSYKSNTNDWFLTEMELRKLIKNHVDLSFNPI